MRYSIYKILGIKGILEEMTKGNRTGELYSQLVEHLFELNIEVWLIKPLTFILKILLHTVFYTRVQL